MNNKVKKRKHKRTDRRGHRYDKCKFHPHCGNWCHKDMCRCGKKRPLNNKVEGSR